MSTTKILLSVDKQGDLVAESIPRSYMGSSYASPKQDSASGTVAPPPVAIHTVNTVSMPYGVRSLKERKELLEEPPEGLLPIMQNQLNTRGNPTHLEYANSIAATMSVYYEPLHQGGDSDYLYLGFFLNALNLVLRRSAAAGSSALLWSNRWTEFQGRFLVLKDERTDILNMDAETGSSASDSQLVEFLDPFRCEYFNLTGINLNQGAAFAGITNFNNYIVLWKFDRFYWSDPLDFTNFSPSVGGAGNAQITDAKGPIVTVVPNYEGLTFYCRSNVVHCTFTGDSENPWIFQEVVGAGGLVSAGNNYLVTGSASSGAHVAYTTNGLQFIQGTQADTLPDKISQYISGSGLERKLEGNGLLKEEKIKCHGGNSHSMLKNVQYHQGILFLYCADTVPSEERMELSQLIIYNTNTGAVSRIQYDVPYISPRYDITTPISGARGVVSRSLMPMQFYAILRKRTENSFKHALRVLDFADTTMGFPLIEDSDQYIERDAEFTIGNSSILTELGINPDIEVEVHSVQLKGINGFADGTERAKVFCYSSVFGWDNPVEFTYYPKTDTYYGYICGKNPRIEVTGRQFYLTNIEAEISRGASI